MAWLLASVSIMVLRHLSNLVRMGAHRNSYLSLSNDCCWACPHENGTSRVRSISGLALPL